MDIASLIFFLVVLGVVVYVVLDLILPLIPLPAPFAKAITILVWLFVAYEFFVKILEPLLGRVRI